MVATNEKNNADVKILIVDDREDNLLSIETILEDENYTIVRATSGRAALKILLTEHDFTLILMDVQMPGMSGFETASLIYEREKMKHVPIIFITAHNQDETFMVEGYKMGAVDFIYKPINPKLLKFKVSVFVDLYQKTKQLLMQESWLKATNAELGKEIQEKIQSEEKIKQLNLQLLNNNEQLKKTVEELDRFAYVASHDLQEPLRKIILFSDKILNSSSGNLDQEIALNLQKIVRASARMKQLVHDLLLFSRDKKEPIEFFEIDLNHLIQDVLSDLEPQIAEAGAKVSIDVLPTVFAMESQIRQVFQNLISNALKFIDKGVVPEITITTSKVKCSDLQELPPSASESDYLHLVKIQDNGIGFETKHANEIFMPFKRLHNYSEYEGTGIGLAICKKVLENHGAYITAESKKGEGSTFNIYLPEKLVVKNQSAKKYGIVDSK